MPSTYFFILLLSSIEMAPYFIRHLRDTRSQLGEDTILVCHVEGIPIPLITWEKEGQQLYPGTKYSFEYKDKRCILTIHNAQIDDSGDYFCIASNLLGKVRTSARLTIIDRENLKYLWSRRISPSLSLTSVRSTTPISSRDPAYYPPKFYSMPQSRVVEENTDVYFQCVIAGEPMPWSAWDKDGRKLVPSEKVIIKEVNDVRSLELKNVTFNDAGLYRITIENDFGRSESTFRLDVISNNGLKRDIRSASDIDQFQKFYFKRHLMGSAPTSIGDTLVMSALYTSPKDPDVVFYHNNKRISETDRISYHIKNACISLQIKTFSAQDFGQYLLLCNMNGDQFMTTTYVNAAVPEIKSPMIIRHLKPIHECIEGNVIELQFTISSEHTFDYFWYKNEKIVPNSSDFRYIDFGKGLIGLRIKDPFINDSGTYKCEIMFDNAKTLVTETSLIVNEVPENLNSTVKFIESPQNLITLYGSVASFFAMSLPKSSSKVWYINGHKIAQSSNEFLVGIYNQTIFTISNKTFRLPFLFVSFKTVLILLSI